MDGVGRRHFQVRRCWGARITNGDMQLIRCDDGELRIAKLPPELMSNHDDIQRSRWLGGVGCVEDDPCSGQEQNYNDEYRNYRPGKLNLIATVDLRRFTLWLSRALAITDKDVYQKARGSEKDRSRNGEHKHRQPK